MDSRKYVVAVGQCLLVIDMMVPPKSASCSILVDATVMETTLSAKKNAWNFARDNSSSPNKGVFSDPIIELFINQITIT